MTDSVYWISRSSKQIGNVLHALSDNFEGLEVTDRLIPVNQPDAVIIFDLGTFTLRDLLNYRRSCDAAMLAVFPKDKPAAYMQILEAGVNDCISAWDGRVVVSRVKSLLRRANPIPESASLILRHGWWYDHLRYLVTRPSGDQFKFPTRQGRLFQCLFEREGTPVSREVISQMVYDEEYRQGSRKIDMAITALRGKFAEDKNFRIVTLSNKGYLMSLTPYSEPN